MTYDRIIGKLVAEREGGEMININVIQTVHSDGKGEVLGPRRFRTQDGVAATIKAPGVLTIQDPAGNFDAHCDDPSVA
jgi:hypothetical protein